MKRIRSIVLLASLLVTVVAGQDAGPASPSLMKASFSKLPIHFIENRGVYPEEVKYYIQGADKTLYFTSDGVTFRLKSKDRAWVVKLEFVGANPDVVPVGEDRQQAIFSYFKGPEKDWKTGLPSFARVAYRELWPGIDLVYRGAVNQLKYEFVVMPGADPGQIRFEVQGATAVETTDAGGLRIETPEGVLEDAPPVAWQEIDGTRRSVEMAFTLAGEAGQGRHEFGFRVGSYDRTKPVILDPAVLVYCGYLGGSGHDIGYDIAVDAQGNAYVTGSTWSTEASFPARVGPDLRFNGQGSNGGDAFVAKIDASGRGLVYCGYIGGADGDWGHAIAVDKGGNAYITGITMSSEATFPVAAGPDLTYNGAGDAFVAKVNAAGTALLYCGYVGGDSFDIGQDIALGPGDEAYLTGFTKSDEKSFPVCVGPDLTFNSVHPRIDDAFVARVNAAGTALTYCGYIGGSWGDYGLGIAVDGASNAYVVGNTLSYQDFPVLVGPDLTHNGGNTYGDCFVTKVTPTGTGLLYSGFIGGRWDERASAVAVDSFGNVYVTGFTNSAETDGFPVQVGPDLTFNGVEDVFVAKVTAGGTGLYYCGYIGGSGRDGSTMQAYNYRGDARIAVDARGYAYVAGGTQSSEATFPVTGGPDSTYNGGGGDAFVATVYPTGAALVQCGYIGGSGSDGALGIDVDGSGNVYLASFTDSTPATFPVVGGPILTHSGGADVFVAKVAFTHLMGSGSPQPGGSVVLLLAASDDSGRPYLVGTSLGTGPISIGSRKIDLSPDNLLVISLTGLWPWVFSGYQGVIDNKGQAQASIHIPNMTALIGQKIHTAFVTLDPVAPSGIRSISDTFSFTITK